MNARPLMYLITTGEARDSDFATSKQQIHNTVQRAVTADIAYIQIREKHISPRHLLELSAEAAHITSGSPTRLLLNGRFDVARAAGAEGVHLPESGIPISEVRRCVPASFIVGASVHSVEAALEAKNAGADYVMFGPVFATPGKEPKGIDAMRSVISAADDLPVIAVGGIDESNYGTVLATGAQGFAAIRYLNGFVGDVR